MWDILNGAFRLQKYSSHVDEYKIVGKMDLDSKLDEILQKIVYILI